MCMIQDTLKHAIKHSGMTFCGLSRATGLNRMVISRFMAGQTTLRVEAAEILLEYFGYELRPVPTGDGTTRKG